MNVIHVRSNLFPESWPDMKHGILGGNAGRLLGLEEAAANLNAS
jgi:hypothetical protein